MKYYSELTKGFYDSDFHAEVPSGAIQIGGDLFQQLIVGQAEGKSICVNNGIPELKDPTPPGLSDLIKRQIMTLETQQTPRRIREALLGTDEGWLAGIESQIEALRAQLGEA